MSSGESRRRAEIEAKRAKLAELKRAREERTSRLAVGRSDGKSASEAQTPSSRKDLDDLVASLVTTGRASSSASGARPGAGTPSSPKRSQGHAGSEYDGSETGAQAIRSTGGTTMVNRADGEIQGGNVTTGVRAALVDSEAQTEPTSHAQIPPQVEKVYYTKETQTATTTTERSDADVDGTGIGSANGYSSAIEDDIRAKIAKEQEIERLRKEEETFKLQEEQLEREIEQGLRELTSEELNAIFGASEFVSFVERSSKIVERALTDNYDYLKDYTMPDDPSANVDEGKNVRQFRSFWDEKLCKGRSLTDLDWSTKHPELVVASYSRSDGVADDQPDGLVLVWNLHLADRPEFVFHAQTDVLSVCFSPFHPNLVIGGTYSGQILIWDTQARHTAVLKTPLTAAGHTHPVYSIRMVGTQNAHNLITASTDGTVCSWMLDMLARPQETVELLNSSHPKTDEISATVIGFPDQESTSFLVGTEDGNVYSATRYDRAGWKAGISLAEVYRGHAAPITGLHFHPLHGPVDFSDLFLTSSMDWTSRLWRLRSGNATSSAAAAKRTTNAQSISVAPLFTFEESNDYVYDAAWHTRHPSLFAQVDGTGNLSIVDINADLERPVVVLAVGSGRALNKIRWDRDDGKRLATGGADGKVYIFDVGRLALPREEEWLEMQKTLSSLASGGPATGGASTGTTSQDVGIAPMSVSGQAGVLNTPGRTPHDFDRLTPRTAVR